MACKIFFASSFPIFRKNLRYSPIFRNSKAIAKRYPYKQTQQEVGDDLGVCVLNMIIIIIIIIIIVPETRKYWVDIQRGIVLSLGVKGPL